MQSQKPWSASCPRITLASMARITRLIEGSRVARSLRMRHLLALRLFVASADFATPPAGRRKGHALRGIDHVADLRGVPLTSTGRLPTPGRPRPRNAPQAPDPPRFGFL